MDEPQSLTVTLPAGDWNVMLAGLYELPMKVAAPAAARLQAALADAQKTSVEPPPALREVKS